MTGGEKDALEEAKSVSMARTGVKLGVLSEGRGSFPSITAITCFGCLAVRRLTH
jgi:hypothetical protein